MSDTIGKYLEQLALDRARAWNEGQAMIEGALGEKRSLSGEEREKLDRINADMDRLDEEIRSWTDRLKREHENDEARSEYEKFIHPEPKDEQRGAAEGAILAEVRTLQEFLSGERRSLEVDLTAIAREKFALRAGATGDEFRALTVGTGSAGGTTVPTTFARSLYDYLEVYTGMRRVGATILTTASGEPMEFPRVAAHGSAAGTTEGGTLGGTDPTFGRMRLDSYKYAQLIQLSSELISDSGVDMLGFVARDAARALARVTDNQYVLGTGSSAPQGIIAAMATAVTGGTGQAGAPTYANLVSMVYSVNEEYRLAGARWLTSDTNAGKIRSMVDLQGRPLWEPSIQVGQPDRLLGYAITTDPNVAAFATGSPGGKGLAFGDFSAFYIRDVGSVRFERSDDFAFSTDMVTFRAIIRTDSDFIDTNAAKLFIGGTA